LKVAKLHKKVMNQRKNFLHHKSKELASTYDAVIIENLDMKGMPQALHFGKSVHNKRLGHVHDFLGIQTKRTRETACQNRQIVSLLLRNVLVAAKKKKYRCPNAHISVPAVLY